MARRLAEYAAPIFRWWVSRINLQNAAIQAGAAGVAVISAIVAADDITLAAGKIARVIVEAQRTSIR